MADQRRDRDQSFGQAPVPAYGESQGSLQPAAQGLRVRRLSEFYQPVQGPLLLQAGSGPARTDRRPGPHFRFQHRGQQGHLLRFRSRGAVPLLPGSGYRRGHGAHQLPLSGRAVQDRPADQGHPGDSRALRVRHPDLFLRGPFRALSHHRQGRSQLHDHHHARGDHRRHLLQ